MIMWFKVEVDKTVSLRLSQAPFPQYFDVEISFKEPKLVEWDTFELY